MSARFFELLMYILFALAVLPLALLEGHFLAYFLMNLDMIQVRDSALEAPAVAMAINYTFYFFVPAILMALYVLVVGSRIARINVAFLVLAFCVCLYLNYLGAKFAFNTPERLYLESVPILVFVVLPILFLVRRWKSRGNGPNHAFESGRAEERRAAQRER